MKNLILCAIAGALLCTPAGAQPQRGNANGNNNFGAQNGAIFQLPPSVQNVVSIDALNMIIVASDGEREGDTIYTPSIIQHVYSGGIARLFGGTAVPTAQFATPGLMNGNNGGNNNGGFGGQNNGVSNGGGFGNGGFNNGGFNNGGFGGQNNGFGNNFNSGGFGGFNNGATFQNGVLGGNGFNTQNAAIIANARLQTRGRTR